MINRNAAMAAGLVLAFSATGCKNREAQLEGKWKATDISLPKDQTSAAAASMVKSMLGSFTLEFKNDKTYAMNAVMFPIEGTWSLSGDTITMKATKMMGMDVSQMKQNLQQQAKTNSTLSAQLNNNPGALDKMGEPQTATLSDDGKTLTITNNAGGQGNITFTKDAGSGS